MNKRLLVLIVTLLSAFQAMGQETVFHADNPNHQNDISRQANWKFFKGDTGQVLCETKADNRKWYYVRMHVKPRNAPKSFVHAAYIYGWISEEEMF